jgi:hypothetical protein
MLKILRLSGGFLVFMVSSLFIVIPALATAQASVAKIFNSSWRLLVSRVAKVA